MFRRLLTLVLALAALDRASGLEAPLPRIAQSLAALHGAGIERDLEESKLLYFRSRYTPDPAERRRALERAIELTEHALEREPRNPGALIGFAASHGAAARELGILRGLRYVGRIERALLVLREVAPAYEGYAADRGLGMLYHEAPAFVSVGSDRKARRHFLAALAGAGDYPGNLVAYARFLKDKGEDAAARELATKALRLADPARYPLPAAEWEAQAREVLSSGP